MKRELKHSLLMSGLLLSIAGCSFWGGPEEVQPQELVEFQAEKSLEKVWSVDIGTGFRDIYHQASPVVAETGVYVTDAGGRVSSYALANGRQLWSVELGQKASSAVGVGFGILAVGVETGELVALTADRGDELWRVALGSEALASPQITADKVIVQLVNGQVVALERQSGARLWVYDAQEPTLSLRGTSTPLVLSDGVLAGFANGKVVALNLGSGAPVWEIRVADVNGRSELERLIDIDGRFLIAGDLIYTGGYQGRLVAINPANASTLWTREFSTYHSLAAGFGNIYASDAKGAVEAFDAVSSASVWRNDSFSNRQLSAPVVLGNEVVVGDGYGYLHLLSQVDGRLVGRFQVDGSALYAEPVVVGDLLFVLSNAGKLSALKLR